MVCILSNFRKTGCVWRKLSLRKWSLRWRQKQTKPSTWKEILENFQIASYLSSCCKFQFAFTVSVSPSFDMKRYAISKLRISLLFHILIFILYNFWTKDFTTFFRDIKICHAKKEKELNARIRFVMETLP